MIPFDLHYQWPSGSYLMLFILPAIFLFWYLYAFRKKAYSFGAMCWTRNRWIYWLKAIFYLCSLVSLILALMWPVGNAHYLEDVLPKVKSNQQELKPFQMKRKAHDVVFLLDVSSSMEVTDTRIKKSRLEYAKSIIDQIIASLKGENVALYAFTTETSQLVPLTLDYLFARLMVKDAQINEGGIPGTDLTVLLKHMQATYFSELLQAKRLKTFVLLSDGEDTAIEFMPLDQKNEAINTLKNILSEAGQNHLRFYSVGMGTTSGGTVPHVTNQGAPVVSHLNASLLKLLAATGRGKYFEANVYTAADLAQALLHDAMQDPPYYENKTEEIDATLIENLFRSESLIYHRYFQYPLALAIFCLAIVMFFPNILKKGILPCLLLLFSLATQAELTASDDSFSPEMHRAQGYAEAKLYPQAQAIYEALLLADLPKNKKAALQYNIGTLYLYDQNWDQAIQQFNDIKENGISDPSLEKKLNKNLALALFKKAVSLETKNPKLAYKLTQRAIKILTKLPEDMQGGLPTVFNAKQEALLKIVTENEKIKSAKRDQGGTLTSHEILENLIQQQEDLLEQSNVDEPLPFPAEHIKEGQSAIEKLKPIYFSTVYNEQIEGFNQGICQSTPWGEALPLVESGFISAKEAGELLQKEAKPVLIQKLQRKALRDWEKALSEIDDPKVKSSSCMENSSTSSKPQSGSENMEKLLQMQTEDKIPVILPAPTATPVKYPW